jgi:integrase
MARTIKKLSPRAVATLTKAGRHSDGAGLYLFISGNAFPRVPPAIPAVPAIPDAAEAIPAGFDLLLRAIPAIPEPLRRRWVFRYPWNGRVREMGLGPASTVPLARARELADIARRNVADGLDPIALREAQRGSLNDKPTFGEIADALITSKEAEWRNAEHRRQWRVTLTEYAAPLWAKPVDKIDTAAVLAVLTPLWQRAPVTASRVRGRIEAVLDAAKAQGHRSGENPAAWRGHLAHILPKRQKITRDHHAAMDYRNVPAFIGQLRERDAIAALALEFVILTATRSGEVLGAKWPEIDFEEKVWTIPAQRMKAGREHRVPLSDTALAILTRLSHVRTGESIFAGRHLDKPLSPAAMRNLMTRAGVDGATVHGFRSAFRDWTGNETHTPREVAEAALAHSVGDKAEQAYRRSDALEKRRALMTAWAAFLEQRDATNVVPIRSGSNTAS